MSSDNYDAAMEAYAEERRWYDAVNLMELRHVAPFTSDASPRRFLASAVHQTVFDREDPSRGTWTNSATPSWNDIGARFASFTDALAFADSERRSDLYDHLDADGSALSAGEYRDMTEAHCRYFAAAEHREELHSRIGDIIRSGAESTSPRPADTDRRLRRAVVAALSAISEWVRDPDRDPFAFCTDYATPDDLAHLADVARNALDFAAALARETGADELASFLAGVAAHIALTTQSGGPIESTTPPVTGPPIPRTLAPPGRPITAQPRAANAPPAARVRVAA